MEEGVEAVEAACWGHQVLQDPPQHQAQSPDYPSTLASTPCIRPFHSLAPWQMPTGELGNYFTVNYLNTDSDTAGPTAA